MFLRLWVLLLGMVLTLGPLVVQAQSIDPGLTSVVTLDRNRLFRDSAFGRAVLADFKTRQEAMIEENRLLFAALAAEERALTDKRAVMSPEAFGPLAADFDQKAERYRKAQAEKKTQLDGYPEREFQRFWQASVPVLRTLMREIGAKAIVDQQFVLLGAENIDITDQAIARMDQAFPAPASP